jgi:hypothetical protein
MNYKIFVLVIGLLLIGVVSADTAIFYPTIDGYVYRVVTSETYAQIIAGAGTYVYDNEASFYSPRLTSHATTANAFLRNYRGVLSLNTAGLDDDIEITSATVYLTPAASLNQLGTFNTVLTNGTLGDNTNLAAADYQRRGTTQLSIQNTYANVTGANVSFPLNAAGLSYINKTGYTVFFVQSDWDIGGSFGGSWSASKTSGHQFDSVLHATTGVRPWLSITYSSGVEPPVASFTVDRAITRIPHAITVTDTSTNTPTSWEWSWGDGTANSTTQSPSHTYIKRGKFTINMAAINDGGTGVATAASVRVVGYENHY